MFVFFKGFNNPLASPLTDLQGRNGDGQEQTLLADSQSSFFENLVQLSELTLHQLCNFLYQQFVHGAFNDNKSCCPFTNVHLSFGLDGQLA